MNTSLCNRVIEGEWVIIRDGDYVSGLICHDCIVEIDSLARSYTIRDCTFQRCDMINWPGPYKMMSATDPIAPVVEDEVAAAIARAPKPRLKPTGWFWAYMGLCCGTAAIVIHGMLP